MPRTARKIVPNYYYHFLNRGNNKARVFHEHADYAHFVSLMVEATDRVPLQVYGLSLMPNHLHLVARPLHSNDFSRWAHWLFTTHVRRYHLKYGTIGRVWQGRFKTFAIQDDVHLLTTIRYVERNALRAGLVHRAEDWLWGSLRWRTKKSGSLPIENPPSGLPSNWTKFVNEPQSPIELDALRACVNRQKPFGEAGWVASTARKLSL